MPTAQSDGLAIDYDDTGAGEPALLCMPGWCASRHAFDAITERLRSKHRVLALDWRGHGRSGPASGDFGMDALVSDALAVVEASGARRLIPLATAHAGWVAIELRRRLGARVPRAILVDWIVSEAPPPLLAGLGALATPGSPWRDIVEHLFSSWTEGVDREEVIRFVREDMGSYGEDMWRRAAREIAGAYTRETSPLKALDALSPTLPTLHLYAQPPDPGYLAMQRDFAASHPWFSVEKLDARSHFPTIEVPDAMAGPIERFVAGG